MSNLWTKQELSEQIAEWKKALKACASGKSYSIDNRTLTRQDVSVIMDTLDKLQAQYLQLSHNGRRGSVMVRADIHGGRR